MLPITLHSMGLQHDSVLPGSGCQTCRLFMAVDWYNRHGDMGTDLVNLTGKIDVKGENKIYSDRRYQHLKVPQSVQGYFPCLYHPNKFNRYLEMILLFVKTVCELLQ